MGQLLDRMGRYIKGVDTLILSDRIHTLELSRKNFSLESAGQWALKNKFYPVKVKTTNESIVFELKPEPHYSRRSNKETHQVVSGVKALCYKTINPHTVVVDRKRVQDPERAKVLVGELELNAANIETDDDYFYFKQFDMPLEEAGKQMRKRISPLVEYIYYERTPQSFIEENPLKTTKRKGLLDQPQTFQVHAQLEVASKSSKSAGGDFVIEGFASTGEIDRDLDIVAPEAFAKALDSYMENPICCYMHNWADPIGVITYAKVVSAGQIQSVGRKNVNAPTGGLFVRAAISNTAPRIRQLIEEGVLKAFSIGFMIKDAEYDEVQDVRVITDLELYEISVVSIPSNRRSLFSVSKALKSGTDLTCDDCSRDASKAKECCAHKHAGDEGEASNESLRARLASATKGKKLTLKNRPVDECLSDYCKTLGLQMHEPEGIKGLLESRKVISHDEVRSLARSRKGAPAAAQGSQIERFLNTETHEQRVLTESYGYFELGLIAKSLSTLSDSDNWDTTQLLNFEWDGKLARPIYAQLEVGRDKKEEHLVEGYRFLKNASGQKLVAQITPQWGCFDIRLFYAETSKDAAREFLNEIRSWADDNNFYKGEKITFTGKFLPVGEETFDDLKLPEEQKQVIKFGCLDFFSRKALYQKNALAFKRGIIFSGEPGTGKTLTGKILLANTKSTFVWVAASDLVGSGDVKRMFAMARSLAPCIIFAEDVDDLIQYRTNVDALKTEMDGLKSNDGIVTVLCTNFPDKLPGALIDRPGRFDDVVKFELPDSDTRLDILMGLSKSMAIENRESSLKTIADKTDGFSGAHLKELLTYALLLAVDSNREEITAKDLEASLAKMNQTRQLVASLNLSKAYTKGLSRKLSASKGTRKEYHAATKETMGESTQSHNHAIRLFLEFDDLERIVSVEGLAEQGDNDHSHPIMEVGKTEIVGDHYHTYGNLQEGGPEASTTNNMVSASFTVQDGKLVKAESTTYAFKNTTREFVTVTTQAEGPGIIPHEHNVRVSVTFDGHGEILTITGTAEQGDNDHSHTISTFGETDTTNNHYHLYSLVWDVTEQPVQPTTEPAAKLGTPSSGDDGPRPDSPDAARSAQAPAKTKYVVPKDIMEAIIEASIYGPEVGNSKLLNVVQYLEDLLHYGAKKANSRYYTRALQQAVAELDESEKLLQKRLDKVLSDLKTQGIF